MLVKKNNNGSYFTSFLEFKPSLTLEADKYYEFEFKYLINVDICDENGLYLKTYFFKPDDIEEEILFESNRTDVVNDNTKWNRYSTCVRNVDGNYSLTVWANGYCADTANNAFIAVDDLIVRQLDIDNLPPYCIDPTTTTIDYTTTTTNIQYSVIDEYCF